MPSTWSIERDGRRLCASLRGRADEGDLEALETWLRELFERTDGPRELMVLLDDLDGLSTKGRLRLADVQRYVATLAIRTVYVSNRPLFRGVALWIVHTSDDVNARAFPTAKAAEHWFQTRDDRPTLLRTRAMGSLRLLEDKGKSSP